MPAFKGKFIELPWHRWRGVRISPEKIITPGEREIRPDQLDLVLWKSAFYDRGRREGFEEWPFAGQRDTPGT